MKWPFFLVLLLSLNQAFSQEEKKKFSSYDRSSLSWLIVNKTDNESFQLFVENFLNQDVKEKFYANNLKENLIEVESTGGELSAKILDEINKGNIGREIISLWYSRKESGEMSPDLFFERGLYNAKDEDVIKAQALKRGLDYIKDYGEDLIEKSYVIVLNINSITKFDEYSKKEQLKSLLKGKIRFSSNYRGYIANLTAYLYRIDFTEQQKYDFYDKCWIYEDDDYSVKTNKRDAFNSLNVGFTYVGNTNLSVSSLKPIHKFPYNLIFKTKTHEQIMKKVTEKAYDQSVEYLTMNYEDFQVKVPIYDTKPIQAKIGKKEGLRPDDRYLVYEYTLDEESGKKELSLTSVVRASKVINNKHVATGNMEKSKFRQAWGTKTEPGQLMVEKNDFGWSGSFGYEMGKVQGMYWKIDVLLGRAFHFPISNLYFSLTGAYETLTYTEWNVTYKNQKFLRYSYTFSYPFYVGKNLNIKPNFGICAEQLRDSDKATSAPKSPAWILGSDISYGFKHYLEIYGGANYYGFYDYSDHKDFYKDRIGLSYRLGVRFSF